MILYYFSIMIFYIMTMITVHDMNTLITQMSKRNKIIQHNIT